MWKNVWFENKKKEATVHHEGINEKQAAQRGRATLKLSAKSNLNTPRFWNNIGRHALSPQSLRHALIWKQTEKEASMWKERETSVSFILPPPG